MNAREVLIKILEDEFGNILTEKCKITKVDEDKRTAICEPLNGDAKITGVHLQGVIESESGFVIIPKKDSIVNVSFYDENSAFVSLTSEVEKIFIQSDSEINVKTKNLNIEADQSEFNGGKNNGLIILSKLSAEIEKLNANFDVLKAAVSGAPVVTQDGGASFKAALSAALIFQKADLSGVEDKKVKH